MTFLDVLTTSKKKNNNTLCDGVHPIDTLTNEAAGPTVCRLLFSAFSCLVQEKCVPLPPNRHIYLKKVMDTIKKQFAQKLMEISAIKLQPNEPFTWASGWKSPIYTDNRKTLGFPQVRSFVKLELCHAIQQNFPEAEAVAGVATGAIAQGALVADELGLPYAYVRPKPKDHGMGNQVEGELKQGAKVVVVEDLISTGGSSLKAVEALRQYGVEVVGMVASFTYGFPVAEEAFREAGVKLVTLSDYHAVLEQAAETGYIKAEDIEVLKEWRKSPNTWKQ